MYKEFAKIYDNFMAYCDYDKWAQLVMDILKKEGIENGDLLDIGCGTGETLIRLKDNYSCTGLDLSLEMLKVAKKKLKKTEIELYHENMINFELEKSFDSAISLFDTVNHILYHEDLVHHFISVSNHLKEGGIYIFDIVDRTFMEEIFPCDTYVDKRKNLIIIWEHEIEDGIDFIDATYLVKNKMGTYDMSEENYEKKIFTQEEVENALIETGLRLVRIEENSEIAGRRFFYILKKVKEDQ